MHDALNIDGMLSSDERALRDRVRLYMVSVRDHWESITAVASKQVHNQDNTWWWGSQPVNFAGRLEVWTFQMSFLTWTVTATSNQIYEPSAVEWPFPRT